MSKLVSAMCSYGYGNWQALQRSAHLTHWSLKDVAKACRHIVIQLLCWSSMPGDGKVDKFWSDIPCPEGIAKNRWGHEDFTYFDDVLRTSKLAKVAISALAAEFEDCRAMTPLSCSSIEEIYNACAKMPQAAFFMVPVDPVELEIPDYFDIITKPMDMGTVKKHLDNGRYTTHQMFAEHMRLTFANAYTYNHMTDNPVHVAAKELEAYFNSLYEPLVESLREESPYEHTVLLSGLNTARAPCEFEEAQAHPSLRQGGANCMDNKAPSLYTATDYIDVSTVLRLNCLASASRVKFCGYGEEEDLLKQEGMTATKLYKLQRYAALQTLISDSRTKLPPSFSEWEDNKVLGPGGIKSYAKNKLRTIEDLFECFVVEVSLRAAGHGWTLQSLLLRQVKLLFRL